MDKIRTSVLVRVLAWFNLSLIIKEGTTRTVWVFPRFGFALKFPMFFFKKFFRSLWHYRGRWKFLKSWFSDGDDIMHSAQFYLLKGILDNWREFTFFLRHTNEPFLLPTYFSFFGLFNITPLGAELPDEVDLWHFIFDATGGKAQEDGHHFCENTNFCVYEGNIRMRDYGAKRTQRIILTHLEKFNSLPSELILG